jgi:transposase
MHAVMGGRSLTIAALQSKIDSMRCEAQQSAVKTFRAHRDKAQVAEVFNVSLRTVNIWIAKDDCGAPMGHLPNPGRPRKLTDADLAVLRQAGSRRETGTVSKAAAALKCIRGTVISKSTAWRALTSNKHAFRVYRPIMGCSLRLLVPVTT